MLSKVERQGDATILSLANREAFPLDAALRRGLVEVRRFVARGSPIARRSFGSPQPDNPGYWYENGWLRFPVPVGKVGLCGYAYCYGPLVCVASPSTVESLMVVADTDMLHSGCEWHSDALSRRAPSADPTRYRWFVQEDGRYRRSRGHDGGGSLEGNMRDENEAQFVR